MFFGNNRQYKSQWRSYKPFDCRSVLTFSYTYGTDTIIEPVCLIVCDVQYRGPQTAGRKPRIQGRIRTMGALAGALLIGLDRFAHLNLIECALFPSHRKVERERETEQPSIFPRSLSCPVSVPSIMFDFDFIRNYYTSRLCRQILTCVGSFTCSALTAHWGVKWEALFQGYFLDQHYWEID